MLSFDIRSLEAHAAAVDAQLGADDAVWQPDDPRPDDGLHVHGRLSWAGAGRFYWHGTIEGDVTLQCRRCLVDAHAHVEDESHVIFSAEGDVEDADDPDIYRYEPNARELDLRPALREEWLLVAPHFGLCRPDCKGLCPRCGADLNAGSCACPPQADSRWDGLRKANA